MAWIVLIGLGAGVTSALLFAAVATGQTFAIALFYLTPLPIVIAGIGWSHLAGAIAAFTAAVLVGGFFGFWFVFAFFVAIGVPAYVLSYLTMLARPASDSARPRASGDPGAAISDGQAALDSRFRGNERSESALEWYPVGRLVIAAALIAAASAAISVAAFGFDVESYRNGLKSAFERVLRSQLGTPAGKPLELPGAKDTQAVLTLLAILMPPAAATFSMITLLANLWLGGRIARISGRLNRPWPDIGAMTFPAATPLLLAGSIAATFVPGIVGLIAVFFAATLLLAYAILGFAVIHGATRGISARTMILIAVWLSVFVLGWPILLVMLLGLADTFIDLRSRVRRGGPPDLSPNQPKE